jgi:tetratricopeptide (TPR) repeat protein
MIPRALLVLVLMAGCVSVPPPSQNPHILQDAERLYVTEQYLLAARQYESYLETCPQDPRRPELRVQTGKCYLGAARADLAIQAFDRALTEDPPPPVKAEAIFRRAVAYRLQGDSSRALEGFRQTFALPAPERDRIITNDELHYESALAHFRAGDWTRGQTELAVISARGSYGSRARMRMGLTFFTVQVGTYGNDDHARQEAERLKGIVRVIPGDRPLFAVVAGAFPHYDEAQEEAQRLRMQYPDAFVIP